MADRGAADGRLELGRVLPGVVAALGRNWLWLLLVCLPLRLATQLVYSQAVRYGHGLGLIARGSLNALPALTLIGVVVNAAPAVIVLTLIVARVTAETDRPKPLAGLGRIPMAIVTGLISKTGVTIGYVLLVAPGVLLGLAWAVAIPAVVVEGLAPPKCFARSADLTRGHRWAIFWLGLIYTAGSTAFSFSVSSLRMMAYSALRPSISLQTLGQVSLGASVMVSALSAAVYGVGVGVIYRELVRISRGASARTLATVFD